MFSNSMLTILPYPHDKQFWDEGNFLTLRYTLLQSVKCSSVIHSRKCSYWELWRWCYLNITAHSSRLTYHSSVLISRPYIPMSTTQSYYHKLSKTPTNSPPWVSAFTLLSWSSRYLSVFLLFSLLRYCWDSAKMLLSFRAASWTYFVCLFNSFDGRLFGDSMANTCPRLFSRDHLS